MSTTTTISCKKCGNPTVFILPPQTSGGQTEYCKKCSNRIAIVFDTDRNGKITDIRIL